jgi:hypothetical protein
MEVIVVFAVWMGVIVGGVSLLERVGWDTGWFTATALYCLAFVAGISAAGLI